MGQLAAAIQNCRCWLAPPATCLLFGSRHIDTSMLAARPVHGSVGDTAFSSLSMQSSPYTGIALTVSC